MQPSISDASKISGLMPMIAAMSMIVVFPNHMRKFIRPTSVLVPNTDPRKSIRSLIHPRFIRIELIGPLVENIVKNSIAKADAIIRFGR